MRFSSLFTGAGDKNRLAVVFDIGSASVGAALVGLQHDGTPNMFYTTRRDITISKKLTSDALLSEMAKALEKAAHDIVREGFSHVRFTFFNTHKPVSVFVTLASPWHVSQVRTIRKKDPRSFRVDEGLIRELIFNELNEFKKVHELHLPNHAETTYEIIEGDVLDVRLNRYEVRNPVGKSAHELEMTLFTSSAPTNLLNTIEKISKGVFANAEVRFASFTFAFFNAVRDIWHEKREYLLIDISGEVSDLSLVKDGRLHDTTSFPFGRNTVIRNVSAGLNLSFAEAESLLSMYAENRLANFEMHRLKKILSNAETEWIRFLTKELGDISSHIMLPHDIYLTADVPLRNWFKSVLSGMALASVTPNQQPFTVMVLDEKTLEPYCHTGLGVHKDPFLIVETLFLNKKMI